VLLVVKKAAKLRLLREPELLHKLKQNIGPVAESYRSPVRSFKEVAGEHDKIYRNLVSEWLHF
jgi:hypothetical protein